MAFGINIAVNEFNDAHGRSIRTTETSLDHTAVTAATVGITRRQFVKQFHELRIIHQTAHREATVGQATLFRKRNQLFDIGTQFLCLWQSCLDLLMLDERSCHVAKHRSTVRRGTLQLTVANFMAHISFLRS